MKRMLIIHPHWPPSNTVGVHRVRLIANELHSLRWQATVLTIDERDLEEDLSFETLQLVDDTVEVVKVRATPVLKIFGKRLVGDIGLRGFNALKKEAHRLLAARQFQFIWFSLPSWYTPLMGPALCKTHGVPYGVDYRDPWVYKLAPHQRGLNRATATVLIARALEPRALRKASLISGVSDGYLKGLNQRYPHLSHIARITFQMGFRAQDHQIELPDYTPPFQNNKRTFVYAGAYSPNWYPIFRLWIKALSKIQDIRLLHDVEFLFIGTENPELQSIATMAEELGVGPLVREIPERIPFLHVQQALRQSHGAMVLGSIEPHYSASKLFQCFVTAPRVFAFLHEESEASQILTECDARQFYVPYSNHITESELLSIAMDKILRFIDPNEKWEPNFDALNPHTSRANANRFIRAVEKLS